MKKIIVISCSNAKKGSLSKYNGENLFFCANPNLANDKIQNYIHPDENFPNNKYKTWRDWLNAQQKEKDILESYKLYKHKIYGELYNKYENNLYIFSAGWGIVKSSFKLPKYDITFSQGSNIESFKKRTSKSPTFFDYNHLKNLNPNEEIIFIGGSKYIEPFCELTKNLPNKKIIIFKSKLSKQIEKYYNKDNFQFKEYLGIEKPYTNWHYTFAKNEL